MDDDPAPVDEGQRVDSFLHRPESPSLRLLGNPERQTRLELVLGVLKKRVLERTHMSNPLQVLIFNFSHSPAANRPVLAVRNGGARQQHHHHQNKKIQHPHLVGCNCNCNVDKCFKRNERFKRRLKNIEERKRERETNIGGILQLCVCIQIVCIAINSHEIFLDPYVSFVFKWYFSLSFPWKLEPLNSNRYVLFFVLHFVADNYWWRQL